MIVLVGYVGVRIGELGGTGFEEAVAGAVVAAAVGHYMVLGAAMWYFGYILEDIRDSQADIQLDLNADVLDGTGLGPVERDMLDIAGVDRLVPVEALVGRNCCSSRSQPC